MILFVILRLNIIYLTLNFEVHLLKLQNTTHGNIEIYVNICLSSPSAEIVAQKKIKDSYGNSWSREQKKWTRQYSRQKIGINEKDCLKEKN